MSPIVEKESELSLYLEEWASARYGEWNDIYRSTNSDRHNGIYRLKCGNELLQLLYDIIGNTEEHSYTFKVRAFSADLNTYAHSEYSEFSEPLEMGDMDNSYEGINSLQSIDDIRFYMQENASCFSPEELADFENGIQNEIELRKESAAQLPLVKKAMKKQFVVIINNRGGMVPILLEKDNIQCPFCKQIQDDKRRLCFTCSVRFSLPGQ